MNRSAAWVLLLALAACGQKEAAEQRRADVEAAKALSEEERQLLANQHNREGSENAADGEELSPGAKQALIDEGYIDAGADVKPGMKEFDPEKGNELATDEAETETVPTADDLIPFERLDTPITADKTVDWTEAAIHLGEFIAVEGTIVDTHNSGRACFLNYTTEWRDKFYLAILGSNMDDYPESPERYFLNKKVRVVGKVEMYRNRPQIVVESPRHITILD